MCVVSDSPSSSKRRSSSDHEDDGGDGHETTPPPFSGFPAATFREGFSLPEAGRGEAAKRRRRSRWDADDGAAPVSRSIDGGGSDSGGGGGFGPRAAVSDATPLRVVDEEKVGFGKISILAPPSAGGGSSRVYVGNLKYRLMELDVRSLFVLFGAVRRVSMPLGGAQFGRHRGFAFVEFAEAAAAEAALRMDGLLVADR
jgi:hypothetical protein